MALHDSTPEVACSQIVSPLHAPARPNSSRRIACVGCGYAQPGHWWRRWLREGEEPLCPRCRKNRPRIPGRDHPEYESPPGGFPIEKYYRRTVAGGYGVKIDDATADEWCRAYNATIETVEVASAAECPFRVTAFYYGKDHTFPGRLLRTAVSKHIGNIGDISHDAIRAHPVASQGVPAQFVGYQAYLQTDAWKQRREDAIERAGGRCQVCNRDGTLHAHHRTYERLGNELPGDLTALCHDCHKLFHEHSAVLGARQKPRWSFDPSTKMGSPATPEPEVAVIDRLRDKVAKHKAKYPGFNDKRFMEWAGEQSDAWQRRAIGQSMSSLNKKCRRAMAPMDWMD